MYKFKFKLDKMFCVTLRYLSGDQHYALPMLFTNITT